MSTLDVDVSLADPSLPSGCRRIWMGWPPHAVATSSPRYNFVFFSSRSRHTRSRRDWSSDVCSSDLAGMEAKRLGLARKPLYVVPNHMLAQFREIGRAPCRERGEISVGGVSQQKK